LLHIILVASPRLWLFPVNQEDIETALFENNSIEHGYNFCGEDKPEHNIKGIVECIIVVYFRKEEVDSLLKLEENEPVTG
jgi:hypothetical protein